jgi:adenine-specific DNA-methyltransferase
MVEIEKLDGKSMDIVEQNIEQLKELFPSVFSEGKIKFNQLEELLGRYVATYEDHYNFTWHGKRKAGRLGQTPSTGTLRPCKEESVNWDKTENLFIEGDNLEVLKLLQKSYHRQVKMIYIDPPYNTGNDFIYEDDFKDGVKNYLEMTGQLDGEGKKMGTNSSSTGRYHTNWLNMMYPRLKLARNLMCNDGVIFISIDDVEQDNLKKLCNEIFGEENFVSIFLWKSRQTTDSRKSTRVSTDHEYILCYAKMFKNFQLAGKDIDQSKYTNPDNDPRGPWASIDLSVQATKDQRPNQFYNIVNPETGIEYPANPRRVWSKSKGVVDVMLEENRILFPSDPNGRPREKKFLADLKSEKTGFSSWLASSRVGYTTNGTRDLSKLFEGRLFDFPKPVSLLSTLIDQATTHNDIILDFFAGSCSSAHAVLKSNATDNQKRRFVVVQLPELTDEQSEAFKAGYSNIADISKERIRRAGKKMKEENPDYDGDLGFKVFKLDTSNIKRWDAGFDTLETDLYSAVDYLVKGRSDEDVLYELCLKLGLDLSMQIEEKIIEGKIVSVLGRGYLVVCLDTDITMDLVNGIGALKEEFAPEDGMRVVFKDDGFKDDVVKTNALQTLKRYGIEDIKSL